MSTVTMDREELYREIAAVVGKQVDEILRPLAERQMRWGQFLQQGQVSETETPLPKGIRAARVVRALAATRGDCARAAVYAEKELKDPVVAKALAAQDGAGGGFLLREEMAEEIIELLRAQAVVLSFNPRVVPLDTGTMRIPRHTVGAAGGWIAENQNAPATQPDFGQLVLTAKKYASLVPVSNDLLRRGGGMADTVVRDDMVADIAAATDLAYIRGDGTNGQPKGMRYWAASGNVLTANATVNLANVTTDLGLMLQTLIDGNVRLTNVGWIMEARTWRYLITVRDSNGNLVFKPEMDGGTLFGFPFRLTTQIPRNLGGGGNETELYLANFDDLVVGQATRILIDASDTAAYHDGSNVVAAFSLDQTVIRAIVEVDFGARHTESIVVLTGVTWGV